MNKKDLTVLFVFAEDEYLVCQYKMPLTMKGYNVWQSFTRINTLRHHLEYDLVVFSAKIRPGKICTFLEEYGTGPYIISYYPIVTKRNRNSEAARALLNTYKGYINEFKKSGLNFSAFLKTLS